jgi:4-amino-4-deoxy-L-arabinose transferase-like glycosyltransferase
MPVYLAGLYALTGPSVVAVIAFQAVLGTATVLLTFLLVRRLGWSSGTALTAAAVQALDPLAVLYSNLYLTEVYTSCLLLLVIGCALNYRASARARWLPACGVLLAVSILFHPILLFLPVMLLGAPLLARDTRSRRQFGFALVALLVAWAPAALWAVRNWYVGDYLGVSCVTSVNVLKYKAAGTEAELRGTSREAERDRLTRECEAELPPGASAGDRFRLWQRRGVAILLAHPLAYAKVHVKGMVVELVGPARDLTARFLYGREVLTEDGVCSDNLIAAARAARPAFLREGVCYLILGWQGLLGLGLLAGLWQTARRRPRVLVALLVIPLYVLLLSGGPEADPRFRVLYLPILSLLTALGWRSLARTLHVGGNRPIAGDREVRAVRRTAGGLGTVLDRRSGSTRCSTAR